MDVGQIVQLGVAGLAVWVLGQLAFKQNKTINNHLDHSTKAQIAETKAKVLQAKANTKLANSIDKLADKIEK